MTTIDTSGAIHAADGRFTGHIATEADTSVCLVDVPEIDAATADVEAAALEAAGDLNSDLAAVRDESIKRLTDAGLALDQAVDTWDGALRGAFRTIVRQNNHPDRKTVSL